MVVVIEIIQIISVHITESWGIKFELWQYVIETFRHKEITIGWPKQFFVGHCNTEFNSIYNTLVGWQ